MTLAAASVIMRYISDSFAPEMVGKCHSSGNFYSIRIWSSFFIMTQKMYH